MQDAFINFYNQNTESQDEYWDQQTDHNEDENLAYRTC